MPLSGFVLMTPFVKKPDPFVGQMLVPPLDVSETARSIVMKESVIVVRWLVTETPDDHLSHIRLYVLFPTILVPFQKRKI